MGKPAKMSHRHEAILNWLVANPHRPLLDCAGLFGVSQSWLSQIIHSDMFQAKLRERSAAIGQSVYHNITSKLQAIAGLSMERQLQKLESPNPSERIILDSGRTALQALGYLQPTSPSVQQHLHLHATVDADLVMKARERIAAQSAQNAPPQKIIDSGPGQTGNP
jgi:hypothetical protein